MNKQNKKSITQVRRMNWDVNVDILTRLRLHATATGNGITQLVNDALDRALPHYQLTEIPQEPKSHA